MKGKQIVFWILGVAAAVMLAVTIVISWPYLQILVQRLSALWALSAEQKAAMPGVLSCREVLEGVPGNSGALRRAEYFFLVRNYLIGLATVICLCAIVFGVWSRGKWIALTRLRYEKLIIFGSLLPLVIGGIIMYFEIFGATRYGVWYNWVGFAVNLVLLSCAMLYISLAMTRKYVNRHCHAKSISVPPFQRWPSFLNMITLGVLLIAALLPPQFRMWQFVALGWVGFTAIVYFVREMRYLRELTRYREYYRLAAGTCYLSLSVVTLVILLVGVPLWWYLQAREAGSSAAKELPAADAGAIVQFQ